jgi:hypothetical protein
MRYKRDHTLNEASNNAELVNIVTKYMDKTSTYELIFSIALIHEICLISSYIIVATINLLRMIFISYFQYWQIIAIINKQLCHIIISS